MQEDIGSDSTKSVYHLTAESKCLLSDTVMMVVYLRNKDATVKLMDTGRRNNVVSQKVLLLSLFVFGWWSFLFLQRQGQSHRTVCKQ